MQTREPRYPVHQEGRRDTNGRKVCQTDNTGVFLTMPREKRVICVACGVTRNTSSSTLVSANNAAEL